MNPYALLDPAVAVAHRIVVTLATLFHPLPWGLDVAAALVVVTLAVRLALLPLAVAARRSALARAALAPELERLRRRYRNDRDRLTAETLATYRRAGVRPLAGIGPALGQLPVVATLYRLVTSPMIGGSPNLLLSSHLLGAPLAAHWWTVTATSGLVSAPTAVLVALLAALLAIAWAGGRTAARDAAGPPAPRAVRALPFLTVAFAVTGPVAVGLYLVTTTAWTLAERAMLAHWPGLV